ncbi:MAG: Flagellar biosynthetic protein FlhB [Verrucomicrobiota bacterium]|jgi:flagellar biosynthetic protein FlhB
MPEQLGEKTEQPTPRRLEEAARKGQFPRSAEVQTVFVLGGTLLALSFAGGETWGTFMHAFTAVLGHLHEIPLTLDSLQGHGIHAALIIARCAGPVVLAVLLAGLLAGGIQSRFQTASEAVSPNWERLNPVAGFQRIFSVKAGVPALLNLVKLSVVLALTWHQVSQILQDPIFTSTVSLGRIGQFLAQTSFRLLLSVAGTLLVIAAADYAWQWWQTSRDLMMTRDEIKEESRNTEGNPHVKSRLRRRAQRVSQRRMLLEVPQADVVVTNPTHLAVALRYDRRTMKAPRIVAKGSRLNALRIREIARQHQVPILENKPVARMLFKYGRVGAEIPAQLYAAVAEILAWVYRVNRYRYYTARLAGQD